MKTNGKKAIIYDDQCPLCQAYTSGFVKWGILNKENRVSFSELDKQAFIGQLDLARSKKEIPLVDLEGGQTLYGVDALLYLLARRIPFIQTAGKWKPVYWFVNRLYRLISYNRRVIVGSRYATTKIDCAPDFSLKYRLLFLLFAAIVATGSTVFFGKAMAAVLNLPVNVSVNNMLVVCGSGWMLHFLIAGLLMRGRKLVEYLGHLGVIQIIGAFPFLLLVAAAGTKSTIILAVIASLLSAALMTWQHYRRMKNSDFSTGWTICWALSLSATATLLGYIIY